MAVSFLLRNGNQKIDSFQIQEKDGSKTTALCFLVEAEGYLTTAFSLLEENKRVSVQETLQWIGKKKQNLIANFNELSSEPVLLQTEEQQHKKQSQSESEERKCAAVQKFEKMKMQSLAEIDFKNIIGLGAVKQKMFNIILPKTEYASVYHTIGFEEETTLTNCLLFGFPGTGKTQLVKAFAHYCNFSFLQISPSDILGSYVGESEANMKAAFAAAASSSCILFFDEIDGLLANQKNKGASLSNEFLTLADSKGDDVIIFGATNHPYNLPDNVLRRFDHKIYVPLPVKKERCRLLKHYFGKQASCFTDEEYMEIAAQTVGYSGCDLMRLAKATKLRPLEIMQRASFFKPAAGQQLRLVPCKAGEDLATRITMNDIPPDMLLPPMLTYADLKHAARFSQRTTDINDEDAESVVVKMRNFIK